jgi:hypothetical protein
MKLMRYSSGAGCAARETALLAVTFALSGCDACGSKKPYTPFAIESAAPRATTASSASATPAASAAAPAASFEGRKAELAPPNAARWQLGARALQAPPGKWFERAVRADFDGDGQEDVAAWLVPESPEPSVPPGELWYFPAQGAPRALLPVPAFVPTGPGCTLSSNLTQTGQQTLTLDVAARCETRLVSRSAVRAVSVLRPFSARPLVLTLRVAEAAPDEVMNLEIDSRDSDADGRDDVSVSVSVQAPGSAKPATARLLWLDRAAGPSRDTGEPSRSLAAAASIEATRARGKTTSRTTAAMVGNLRRLYASVCAEGGTARVFDEDGAPLPCGNLQSFVDRLALAELTSALTRKSFIEALGVFTRDGWYHGKISAAQRKALEKDLGKAVSSIDIASAAVLEPRPVPRVAVVRYSPLRFEPSGHLLVRSSHGVVRVSPDGSSSEDLGGSVPGWPLEVSREDGTRWTGLTYACDRSEVLLNLSGAGDAPRFTSLLSPRPGTCKGGSVPRVPAPAVFDFRGALPNGVVAGNVIGNGGEAGPEVYGSARSPDGHRIAVATALGVLITHGDRAELWRVQDTGWSNTGASDCVVANDGQRAACIVDERARLLRAAQ